ncbi:tetratricopeptide (TPR) repeat protein [Pedobacter cryoconitis]|uniref:Tetratricopeptide (TPR) repeat protein n=1 Tax=Pedobacter cryoconitis TaxID=188932 RepID=A0A7W8YPU0_9SPHI|nr:tetratricopeptide repeat protein [Pedobacter cryoconitis]MBB5619561.1 tetratricopeptide (TPR) repeat protein [Pedobacter cryoconitis]
MNYPKIFYTLLLLLSMQACAQKKDQSDVEASKALSVQDSARIRTYTKEIDNAPLYSVKRQKYLDSVLLIVPTNAYAWQQKAMPLFKQKKYEIGMSYLDSAVKYDKTNHYLEYRAFIKCVFQKNYNAAIKDFDAAQKIKGNAYVMDHTYEFYKGLCYLQLNKFDTAKNLFKNCINQDRAKLGYKWVNTSSLFYLGICFFEEGNYKMAMDSFDESLVRYNNFTEAKYYKAICLESLGKRKEALVFVKEAEADCKVGYTIPETNTMYEIYPYQTNKYILQYYRERLEGVKNE